MGTEFVPLATFQRGEVSMEVTFRRYCQLIVVIYRCPLPCPWTSPILVLGFEIKSVSTASIDDLDFVLTE